MPGACNSNFYISMLLLKMASVSGNDGSPENCEAWPFARLKMGLADERFQASEVL